MRAWFGLLVMIAWAPVQVSAQNIGHGTDSPGSRRGVLAVKLAYSDRAFDSNLTNAHYQDKLFGSGDTSLKSYYAKASGGRFSIHAGGVLGPYVFPNASDTVENESLIDCHPGAENASKQKTCPNSKRSDAYQLQSALDAAVAAGHDFKQYDTNNDGKVTDGELAMFAIAAEPFHGGGYRCFAPRLVNEQLTCDPYCKTAGTGDRKVSVCLVGGMNFSSRANSATFVHELGHHLGAVDAYGAWLPWGSNLNARASIMAATIDTTDWLVQFDPYHRLRFGWMDRPVVVSADGPSTCLSLSPAGTGGAAVVVHDPKRANEFFLVEYRRRTGADPNVRREGVAVWHVRQDAAGRLGLASDHQLISRNPPGSTEDVPTANIRSASAIRRDDSAVMGWGFVERIEWGADGWLDTSAHESDTLSKTLALHVIGPRAVDHRWTAGPRGDVGLWRREHGTVKLGFPGSGLAGVQLDVGTLRPDGIHVRFTTRSGALPAGTSSTCSADTVPVALPPPASITLQPSCLTRPVANPGFQLTASGVLDFHAPLPKDMWVYLSAVEADVTPAMKLVSKGARSLSFQVKTRAGHTSSALDVTAELQRPAVPGALAHREFVEHTALVLPDRGHFTCRGVPKYVQRTPRMREPVYPMGDGRVDIPVFHLRPLTREQILGGRIPRIQTERLFKNKIILQEQLRLDVPKIDLRRRP